MNHNSLYKRVIIRELELCIVTLWCLSFHDGISYNNDQVSYGHEVISNFNDIKSIQPQDEIS
jgi:hypothetical protein